MTQDDIIPILLLILFSTGLGALILWLYQRIKLTHFKKLASDLLATAEADCEMKRKNAEISLRHQQMEQQREFEVHWHAERRKIQQEEDRLKTREDKIESRLSQAEKKLADIEKREAQIGVKQNHLDEEKQRTIKLEATLLQKLEQIAGLTKNEAKDQLISQVKQEIKVDTANLIRRTIKEATEEADKEASRIIVTAINRLAVPCVSETTINTVTIPSDEMKGRIIGREGRNIRTLEKATGVSCIIDDTPNAIVLSGFDPIRLAVAKMAITDLVQDGRIHPTSIEEAVAKSQANIQKLIKKYGEDAALRVGAINLHPEIITLLGKLKFRYSYGQNILDHSIEVSHLMGLMASELGLDPRLARRIGLLHDMGKAVTHEIEGTHALIGHDLALKYGETQDVANGIGCHHGEIEAITAEGSLCSAADAISASRQGARSESVDEYIKRIKRLEDLALEYPGVEKAFAIQAGREIRVVVLPDVVDDDGVITLARDIKKRIESELSYPGKIRVTVTREKRIVEYAV